MKQDVKEATVILAKCKNNSNNTFGIRTEKRTNNIWHQTWAFKINDKRAAKEGYNDVKVSGQINIEDEYPGCPYCGSKGWFSCGKCGKLTCYAGGEDSTCAWCGNSGELVTAETFDLKGNGY